VSIFSLDTSEIKPENCKLVLSSVSIRHGPSVSDFALRRPCAARFPKQALWDFFSMRASSWFERLIWCLTCEAPLRVRAAACFGVFLQLRMLNELTLSNILNDNISLAAGFAH
jgi:hypothetical protein